MEKKKTLIYIVIIVSLVLILGLLWFLLINNSNTQGENNGPGGTPPGGSPGGSSGNVTYSASKEITTSEDLTSGSYSSSESDQTVISVSGNIKSSLSKSLAFKVLPCMKSSASMIFI